MDTASALRAVLALIFVAGLIGMLGYGLRRWGGSKLAIKLQEGRRLKLVEQLYLDPKRKLMMVQCDGKEYLLLLGPQSERLISGQASVVSRQKEELS